MNFELQTVNDLAGYQTMTFKFVVEVWVPVSVIF